MTAMLEAIRRSISRPPSPHARASGEGLWDGYESNTNLNDVDRPPQTVIRAIDLAETTPIPALAGKDSRRTGYFSSESALKWHLAFACSPSESHKYLSSYIGGSFYTYFRRTGTRTIQRLHGTIEETGDGAIAFKPDDGSDPIQVGERGNYFTAFIATDKYRVTPHMTGEPVVAEHDVDEATFDEVIRQGREGARISYELNDGNLTVEVSGTIEEMRPEGAWVREDRDLTHNVLVPSKNVRYGNLRIFQQPPKPLRIFQQPCWVSSHSPPTSFRDVLGTRTHTTFIRTSQTKNGCYACVDTVIYSDCT